LGVLFLPACYHRHLLLVELEQVELEQAHLTQVARPRCHHQLLLVLLVELAQVAYSGGLEVHSPEFFRRREKAGQVSVGLQVGKRLTRAVISM